MEPPHRGRKKRRVLFLPERFALKYAIEHIWTVDIATLGELLELVRALEQHIIISDRRKHAPPDEQRMVIDTAWDIEIYNGYRE